ncbi:PaaI family thioesterase [Phenylobacterium sp.]|uniref:PaaI family thioesterase n=1 Tax=Phenylobacterium sp. TaxID=1871053 RepID=UPI0035B0217E
MVEEGQGVTGAGAPEETSGLARLRAALARPSGRPGLGATLGFRLVAADPGRVVFEGEPTVDHTNPLGSVHGGYAAALLDSAMGCALQTRLDEGRGYGTVELQVAYHRPLSPGRGRVRAEGWIVTLGARLAFAEATLVDARGRLCATGRSSLLLRASGAP